MPVPNLKAYGILDDGNPLLRTLSSQYGWAFEKIGTEPLYGVRILTAGTTETVRVLRVTGQALLGSAVISGVAGSWVEAFFAETIELAHGERYIVTMRAQTLASRDAYNTVLTSGVVLSPALSYVGISFLDDNGYPGFAEGVGQIGGLTDVILEGDPDPIPPPPAPARGVPTDRYRLSLSADSRSLLASARAVPFDASSTINLPAAVGLLPQQTLYPVRELTRAVDDTTADAAFYPRATQNQNHERQYDGVTLMTRMRSAFPAKITDTTASLGLANNRAQTIITYVLTRWAAEFAWFDFEPVPDLRTPVPGGMGLLKPSEYDTLVDYPRLGVVNSEAIVFPQDATRERLSMLDMLEALLSPFPGTVYFANSVGKLQIVPVYGPDADGTPFKTLTNDDVASISLGEPSVADIINKATVSSRGYQQADDVPLMQPAWAQFGPSQAFGMSDRWYAPPADRVNMQSTGTEGEVLQETLTPANPFSRQNPLVWPIDPYAIPAGNGISLVNGSTPQITVGWTVYRTSSVLSTTSGSSGLTLIENSVPFDGVTRDTFKLEVTADTFINLRLIVTARWDAARSAIVLAARVAAMHHVWQVQGAQYILIAEFTFDDSSRGVVETTGVTVTYDASTDAIPGAGGINAIQESVDAYGVLEERVDVRGYVLTSDQALGMARGIVLANLSPRAVRELDLGVRGSTVPHFDDRGRLVAFPVGGEGLLVGVAYQDDFVSRAWSKRVRIEETIVGAAGFIPTTNVWLLNEDNSFYQNDDGGFSPPA
jgi:hypothetical protein